jgi:hypothetical protein
VSRGWQATGSLPVGKSLLLACTGKEPSYPANFDWLSQVEIFAQEEQ